MNLEDALLLHFEMKLELRMAMLEGRQLDCAQIADDCGCELGRWLRRGSCQLLSVCGVPTIGE
jgi:hypothetical protein